MDNLGFANKLILLPLDYSTIASGDDEIILPQYGVRIRSNKIRVISNNG